MRFTQNARKSEAFFRADAFDADEPDAKEIGLTLGELVLRNNAKQGLFGLLHADGNLTLAHPNSNEEVGPCLLYTSRCV